MPDQQFRMALLEIAAALDQRPIGGLGGLGIICKVATMTGYELMTERSLPERRVDGSDSASHAVAEEVHPHRSHSDNEDRSVPSSRCRTRAGRACP